MRDAVPGLWLWRQPHPDWCGLGGALRVWATPWHEERTLPALRALLELPFEHVLVSHGEPVHGRDDFVAALDREPWGEHDGA